MRTFHELCVNFLILTIFLVSFSGCGGIVRDQEVYEAEIAFMGNSSSECVERGIALIEESCECAAGPNGKPGFTTKECHELAETIVVIQARMNYHLDYMRYLGGLTTNRPAGDPPEIPDPGILCSRVVQ